MTTSTTDENWQEVQIKTFTNWINSKLKLNGYPLITDLFTDISDGTVVINLIHCITGILLDHNQAPSTKYQCLENHQFVIQFLEENKVQVVNIRPSDLVDGNEKLTLGLIWIVILKFGITGMIEENSNAKKALLAWCKAVTQPYHNVNVKDFSQSWKDGLAFNAIIHRFRPDLIGNFSDLDSKNAKFNVNKAFEVAENKLGIPKLMDAEDITEALRPDEKSIFTYVSEYYNKFSTFENELSTKNKMSELIKLINWSINARNEYENKAVSFLQMQQAFKEATLGFEEEFNKLVTKIVTVNELVKLLNDEFLSIKGLKSNIDLVHKIYNLKKFEVPENISLEKLDKGVFTTQISQFKNYSFLLKLLKKEENLEKEILEVKELKNEFEMKENLNSQINELSQKLTNISLKNNNLLKNPQLVIDDKLKVLLELQINVKKREDFLKKASDLFKQYDKNKKNKIIIDDFIKCLNSLGCFVGQSLEKKINDESSNYFTYDEYMSIMNNYTITNTTSVQFKKELSVLGSEESIIPSFLGLSKEECGNIINNGKIDVKKISEELVNE